MPYAVTDIQATPNPNATKFILDRPISEEPLSFFNRDAALSNKIASRLFEIEGVSSLLLLNDFVTVNKRPEVPWKRIKAKVVEILKKVE